MDMQRNEGVSLAMFNPGQVFSPANVLAEAFGCGYSRCFGNLAGRWFGALEDAREMPLPLGLVCVPEPSLSLALTNRERWSAKTPTHAQGACLTSGQLTG